jgi:hypothetical protein
VQPWRAATDVLIMPEVHHILWDEFKKTPQLVAAGEDAAYAAMPRIKSMLSRFDGQFASPRNSEEIPFPTK